MGEQFAIAFDIAVVLILLISAFVGFRRGFTRVVLGLVSTAAAFAFALFLSEPIAEGIYGNFVAKPIEEQLDSQTDAALGSLVLGNIVNADFEKVVINGTAARDFEVDYAGTRKAVIDLSNLDLSQTGLTADDLLKIGITEGDLSQLSAKTAEFTMDDILNHGLGKLAAAQYIAVNLVSQPMFAEFDGIIETISGYLPNVFGSASSGSAAVTAIRTVTVQMLEADESFKTAVMNGVIKPNCTLLIRTIVFGVLFVIMSAVFGLIMAAAKLINKIPVVGTLDSFLGLILGLIEGMLAVFLACLATRLVITLAGANTMVFNQTTIDATYVFKTFYDFDFLNFLA